MSTLKVYLFLLCVAFVNVRIALKSQLFTVLCKNLRTQANKLCLHFQILIVNAVILDERSKSNLRLSVLEVEESPGKDRFRDTNFAISVKFSAAFVFHFKCFDMTAKILVSSDPRLRQKRFQLD